jgi:hypothetical protein
MLEPGKRAMKGSDHRMGEKFKKNPQAMLGDFCIRDSLEGALFNHG